MNAPDPLPRHIDGKPPPARLFAEWDQDELRDAMMADPAATGGKVPPSTSSKTNRGGRTISNAKRSAAGSAALSALMADGQTRSTAVVAEAIGMGFDWTKRALDRGPYRKRQVARGSPAYWTRRDE